MSLSIAISARFPVLTETGHSMAKKKRVGRPATGKTPARQIGRVSDEDWQLIGDAAEQLGQSKTEFMVDTLLRRARRVLRESDQGSE